MDIIERIDAYDPEGPDRLGQRKGDFPLLEVWHRDGKTLSITQEQLQNSIDSAGESEQARNNLRSLASVLRAFADHMDMLAEGRKPS